MRQTVELSFPKFALGMVDAHTVFILSLPGVQ